MTKIGRSLTEILDALPADSQARIHDQATELAAEVISYNIADLRREMGVTQSDLAAILDTSQAAVSKLEKSSDHRITTIQRLVAAYGGHVTVTAHIGDKQYPIALAQ